MTTGIDTGNSKRGAPAALAAQSASLTRTITTYAVVFTVFTVVFWLFRERSHSGDYSRWIAFVGSTWWYRLREPICLVFYKIPLYLLRPYGVGPKAVIAGFSYVCGGLSFCYILATLRLLTPQVRFHVLGLAVFAASYGVVGIFFGHIEHYNIMSLGCFAYVYYALRYLSHSMSVVAPALALGILGTTHLMTAWMFPSLAILPWLKPAGRLGRKVLRQRRLRDLILALAAFGLPNIGVWILILLTYYEASILNLIRDAATGQYTAAHHGMSGNALGGGNRKSFWTLAEILSWSHMREIGLLLFIYSPAAWLLGIVALVRSRREDLRRFVKEPAARLLLALLIPYAFYTATWEAGLGASSDWDLFSHISIFLAYTVLILIFTKGRAAAVSALWWVVALAVSAMLTGYLVLETHTPHSPTGISVLLRLVDVSG